MEENKKIINRLDALIFLISHLLQENENSPKTPELLYQMKQVGMTNEDLSNIFGKTADQIAKTAYEFKRPTKATKATKSK